MLGRSTIPSLMNLRINTSEPLQVISGWSTSSFLPEAAALSTKLIADHDDHFIHFIWAPRTPKETDAGMVPSTGDLLGV